MKSGAASRRGATAARGWHRRAQPLLGTRVEVAIRCDVADFLRLSALAFARIAAHHAAMSFHEAGSDVRAIAAAPLGATLRVSSDTWRVIAAAQALEEASGGVFNVAIGAHGVASGWLPAPSGAGVIGGVAASAAPAGAGAAPAASARRALRLEDDARVTVLEAVWIDLGGIAKGAAVDAALAALRDAGAAAAVVDAGGDLALYGDAPQAISVRGPGGNRFDAGFLADGAIATSGPFDAASRPDLVVHDARRARWAARSVSVVAPTCRAADALTKVLAVLGPDAAALLAEHGAHGFSIDCDGRLERVP